MIAEEVENRIETQAPLSWERWAPFYGPLFGDWLGGLKPPEQRFGLLVQTIVAAILLELDREWVADLDHDAKDRPKAVVLSNGMETKVIRLSLTPRLLRIRGEPISLASPQAGRRILKTIAEECGAFFGRSKDKPMNPVAGAAGEQTPQEHPAGLPLEPWFDGEPGDPSPDHQST